MNIIISGEIEAGKSTVCLKLVRALQKCGYSCGGVLTRKEENRLFVKNIQTGRKKLFALKVRKNRGEDFSRFDYIPEGAEFGQRAVQEGAAADVLIVDEAGSLELEGKGFSNLFKVIEQRRAGLVVLVIRKKVLQKYKERLYLIPVVFEINKDNRDMLHQEIISLIKKKI